MTESERQLFQTTVRDYYAAHGRHDLLWREPEPDGSFDAYKILVSELMLQQTQVPRVIPKFAEFIQKFPDSTALANAGLGEVLMAWNGLGYNRRAKYVHQAAQRIVSEHSGNIPPEHAELVKLPGVGKNTAAAVQVYAFNLPAVFIETNIRTVFIHHFFGDQTAIADKDIRTVVEQTMDTADPRSWYWALMDYGTHLKKTVGNLNKLSKTYTKQSAFHGSKRQMRGQVIRALADGTKTKSWLEQTIQDERLGAVLDGLVYEGFIVRSNQKYKLKQ